MTTNIDYPYGLPVDIVAAPPPLNSDPAAPPFREHLESRRDEAPQHVESAPKNEHTVDGPPLSTLRNDEAPIRRDLSERDEAPGNLKAADGEKNNPATPSSNEQVDPAASVDEQSHIDHGGVPSTEEKSPIADEANIETPHEAVPTVMPSNPQTTDNQGGDPAAATNSGGNTDGEAEAHLAPRLTRDPGDPKPTPLPQPVPGEPDPEERSDKKGKSGGKHEGELAAAIGRNAKEGRPVKEKGEEKSRKTKSIKRATVDEDMGAANRKGKSSGAQETRSSKAGIASGEQASSNKDRRRSTGSKFDKIERHELVAEGAKPGLRANKFPVLISREMSKPTEAVAAERTRNQTTDGPVDGKPAAANSAPVDGDASPTGSPKGDGPGNRLSTLLGHKGASEARQQPPLNDAQQARLVQRVTKAFDVARARGESAVRLRLAPPELGSLRLELQVESGSLIARLEVETPAAREVILDNLNTLRQRLAEQSIRIDQFDVDLLDRRSDDRWQSGEQGQRNHDAPGDERQPTGADEREPASSSLQTPTIERLLDEGVIDVII